MHVYISRTGPLWQNTSLPQRIKSQETEVLAETSGYMDGLAEEAIEIGLHSDNIKKNERFNLANHELQHQIIKGLRHTQVRQNPRVKTQGRAC
jgi:hypothetical protein